MKKITNFFHKNIYKKILQFFFKKNTIFDSWCSRMVHNKGCSQQRNIAFPHQREPPQSSRRCQLHSATSRMKKIAKYFCWYITEKKFWTSQLNYFHKTIAFCLFVFLSKVAVTESTSNLTKQQGLKLTRCALSIE